MTTSTQSLASWLLERIAEDEGKARRSRDVGAGEVPGGYEDTSLWECGFPVYMTVDPARVLAECEAKRRIVELHKAEDRGEGWGSPPRWCCTECGGRTAHPNFGWLPASTPWPCLTLRLLAVPYADREGFREEWRP